MKKILIILLIIILFTAYNLSAAAWFLSPGIRLGYSFNENDSKDALFLGVFNSFGFEISYNYYNEDKGIGYGYIFDLDFCKNRVKLHLGLEGTYYIPGFSFGPTWIFEKGKSGIAFTFISYFGYVTYPYYSFTYRPGYANVHEMGTYIKVPVLMSGSIDAF